MWYQLMSLAMAAPPAKEGQPQQSPIFSLVLIVIMVAIFYMLMIRPQQRKDKARRAMLDNVKTGDKVVFGGGIIGVIANKKEKLFIIKIADKVKVEVARGAITQVLENGDSIEDDTKK